MRVQESLCSSGLLLLLRAVEESVGLVLSKVVDAVVIKVRCPAGQPAGLLRRTPDRTAGLVERFTCIPRGWHAMEQLERT